MSQQIQFLLNEMESKFEESFSESGPEEQMGNQENPESSKKNLVKSDKNEELPNQLQEEFDQVKNLFLSELKQHNSKEQQGKEVNNEHVEGSQSQQYEQRQEEHYNSKKNNKMGTPNFKDYREQQNENYEQDKVPSSQKHINKSVSSNFEQNRQNSYYYKELTMKLQKALMKISSDKAVGPTKKLTGFYDRVQQFETKKQREIQRRKIELEERQISTIQDRPLINSHSRAIVSQISNDPIYVRAQKIMEKKKEKQQQNKRKKEEKQSKQYEEFKEQFQTYMKEVKQKYQKGIRSPQEYFNDQLNWTKTKEKNIQSRMTQQKQKMNEKVTFKPLINAKSQKILRNKEDRRVPIQEREPKIREELKDPNCTFKPKINKNTFYKKASYFQAIS